MCISSMFISNLLQFGKITFAFQKILIYVKALGAVRKSYGVGYIKNKVTNRQTFIHAQ